MFEVIWSWTADAYKVRPVGAVSTIKPDFVGGEDDCIKWAFVNNGPHY